MLPPLAACDLFTRGAVMPRQLRLGRGAEDCWQKRCPDASSECADKGENRGNSQLSKPEEEKRLTGLRDQYCHLCAGRGE
jgi:hypothetical protein